MSRRERREVEVWLLVAMLLGAGAAGGWLLAVGPADVYRALADDVVQAGAVVTALGAVGAAAVGVWRRTFGQVRQVVLDELRPNDGKSLADQVRLIRQGQDELRGDLHILAGAVHELRRWGNRVEQRLDDVRERLAHLEGQHDRG